MTTSTIREGDQAQGSAAASQASSAVTVEFDVSARMRDGVTLRANVYRPDGPGPWPTLLTRLPYGKDLPMIVSRLDPVQVARRGFMLVIQDCRGRFASEGEWDPFRLERQDGYDTVEWAALLPGSNGRVGMYGESYFGNTQWLAAMEQPPSLAAISPEMTWSEPMDGLFARGGAVEFGLAMSWSLQHSFDYLARLGLSEDELQDRVKAVIDEYDRLDEDGYWELPAEDIAVFRRHGIPEFGTFRAGDPDVAGLPRVAGSHERVEVPSFHVGGWHDVFLQGTLDNYRAMVALGREARLVVGPWTHVAFADPIGDRLFGLRAARDGVPVHPQGDLNGLRLAWLRRQLVPGPGVELPEAPVRIFVMGRNEWRDEAAWPPGRAVAERWYLHAGGSLATTGPAAGDQPSEFHYDPANPVPTVGGNSIMSPDYPPGPKDQGAVEARDDVLVFTSEPLHEELEVTGRVRVILHAASSAPSTDWIARLCDVDPDGRSLNLCDGILRVGTGADRRERHEIDLWSTSNVFRRGHRLRVQVTSSSFPRWDRNLNTGDQRATRYEVARQRVFLNADQASYIELPVVKPTK